MAASARDVFYSIQAMVIYFIMAVIENDTARGARMIQTIKVHSRSQYFQGSMLIRDADPLGKI